MYVGDNMTMLFPSNTLKMFTVFVQYHNISSYCSYRKIRKYIPSLISNLYRKQSISWYLRRYPSVYAKYAHDILHICVQEVNKKSGILSICVVMPLSHLDENTFPSKFQTLTLVERRFSRNSFISQV